MRTLWILALCCLAVLLVDAKKNRWKRRNHITKNSTKKPKETTSSQTVNCTVQPSRLLDWFHILRTQHIKEELVNKGLPLPKPGAVLPQMELREAKMPFPSGFDRETCREPISFVFHHVFDENMDGVVDDSELAYIYHSEPCTREFFKKCAKGKETFTEAEFCSCFTTVEPTCFHNLRRNLPYLLVRGKPHPIPGAYVPSCDQDGYYLPRQCKTLDKEGNKECWCVDRHGSKMEGLTECVDNTEPPAGGEHE